MSEVEILKWLAFLYLISGLLQQLEKLCAKILGIVVKPKILIVLFKISLLREIEKSSYALHENGNVWIAVSELSPECIHSFLARLSLQVQHCVGLEHESMESALS